MAKEWQNILDNFSSGKSSTSQSTSSPAQASTSKNTSSNNWQGILDNFSGSRKQAYTEYSNSVASRVITRAKEENKKEEEKKWYEKGHFEDGWDFGDITKTILGVPVKKELKTFEAPDTTDSLEVLKQKSDYYNSRLWNNTEQLAASNKYTQQYNQMALAEYSETLSKTKMDGTNHTVLDEIEILANMKSGKEKNERKQAVLDKMESLGMDTTFYAHFAGDGEFNWSDFGNWIKSSAYAGMGSFNKMFTDTADVLLGAPLKEMGWENNPVSKLNEHYTQAYENAKYSQQLYAEKLGGGAWNFGGDAVEGTFAALPSALLAMMTGGTSLTATSSSLATNAAYQTGSVLTKAGITAETMMKNPQYWTSFAQSLGPKYKEAKEKGVNDSVAAVGAVLSSMFTSGIEIGIDGGSGIQGLPSDLLEEGGSMFLKLLESAYEEGGEEGLQKLVDEGVSKFIYGLEDDYLNPIEYGKDMTLGTIAGLALGSGQVAGQSTANVIQEHNASKLTQNEQAVVDKVVADRIAEQEKDGTKLSNSEKKKITESVVAEMERGYLSIDDIESALGGETYEEYKRVSEWEDGLQNEYNELHAMKRGEMTGEQLDREAHLKEQLKNVKATSSRDALKSKLSEDVFSLASGDRLIESYNERTRRGQVFEADLTKYDAKQQATIQKAIDSGILNNTNRTHEFVDIISKISADKGVLFDFTNNTKLKESGFAIEGKQVNGFVTKDGISINIDSPKAWQSTVGHEVTHVLEGTEVYTELQNTLFEYAKTKGEYDSRMEALTELYKDVKDADLSKELTADLVGEYLFTDENFIKNLSTQNRNVFQKIYDEIKYLYKVATGSKEAKELEKVKRAFDKAYKEAGKGLSDTKYSISETTDGRFAAVVDNDILSNIDTSSWDDTKKAEAKKAASDALKQFSEGIVVDGITRKVNKVTRREYTRSNYTESLYNHAPEVFADKMRAADIADDIVIAATNWSRDGGLTHQRTDNFVDFDHGKTLIVSGNAKYSAEVVVGITDTGEAVLYDVVDMTPTAFDVKKEESPTTATTQTAIGDIQGDSFTDNVAPKGENVKYSLSDSNGKQLSKEQQEYFKDSKVRDENGSLQVMYHGSPESFTVFDKKKAKSSGLYGKGFYFTNSDSHAKQYGNTYEVYLNITNPLQNGTNDITKEQLRNFVEAIAEDEDYGIENYGYEATVDSVTNNVFGKGDFAMLMDINVTCVGNMVEAIELFNKVNGTGYNGIIAPTETVAFYPEQIKEVANQKPTADPDIQHSLSKEGEQFGKTGQFATPATELRYEAPTAEESQVVAPVAENSTLQPETQLTEENSTVTADDMSALFPNNAVPVQEELEQLLTERNQLYGALEIAVDRGSAAEVGKLAEEYEAINSRIKALESKEAERTGSITDADAPAEMDAPLSMKSENYDPYNGVTLDDINRNYRTYSDRNPAARQYIEEAALGFAYDVANSTHGERWYNDELYYATGGEKGFGGTSRSTTDDIADLKDYYGYTWEQLRKAADDVVKGEVRSVAAKRVEYLVHKRLMEGYTDVDGRRYEPNQEYITFLNEQFANEQRTVGFDSLLEDADHYAPYVEEAATVKTLKDTTADTIDAPIFDSKDKNAVKGQTTMFAPEKPKVNPRVARVLTKESKNAEKSGIGMKAVSAFVDKGMVFENLSLDSGNQEVQAKWNSALPANTEKKAQYFMENGAEGVKPLKDIIKDVKKTGKEEEFSDYMYHVHNIDRMSLEDRFGLENKAVFGDTITAEVSTKKVQQYEKANPEFKAIAESVYAYNKHLRGLLVENGVISQETADLWEKEYPHYVPVRRVDQDGKNISVPLDTYKTGVNAPVKRATGGNSDIEPLFNTMAMRTEQVFSAIARNSFGIELKNTLGSTIDTQKNVSGVDEAIKLIEDQESNLLKPGTLNSNPTFTVFENGERVEFEITEDMYDALKPAGKLLGHRNDKITKVSEWRRNMLTTWNPVFALWRNPVKDLQDVMINSQHAAKTYAQLVTPTKDNVIYQIATHGEWAAEYESNGGKGSTYFDGKNKEFKVEDNAFKKAIGFPVRAIENAGEFIEEIPRLAEYIASRKEGRSVERSMLDAARVTTNFAAGGDVTKFANAHGFTFLNASVQGASQHVRNFREATRQDGMKGFVKTLAKYTLAGIPGIILNNMIWDDDEEYEELSDYVKQNYYVVYKTKDGKFFRIPKGRTAAVMNNALEQMQHLVTGDDEADFGTFYELFMNNIAPNNPIENNILAPIKQVMDNRAWYGDDLVPTRLQDLPAEEQFDESTDALSKLIGEKTGTSPYKWNYLIDQYSGGLGDMILPMMTPEAESGDNTFVGNMLAPWKKEMTTDSTLNNKYPGNFYDLKDELDVVANGKNATEEDKMKSMYLDSVSWDMGELYAQKREIQNSDLPDDQKYAKVREIQAQINELANNALDKYNHVRINGAYAEAGDRRFNFDSKKNTWYEITPKNAKGEDNWYYIQEKLSHDKLGMSYDDFWNGKEPPANFAGKNYYAEYNGKRYDYSEYNKKWYEIEGEYLEKEQKTIKRFGITPEEYWNNQDKYYHANNYFKNQYEDKTHLEIVSKNVFDGEWFAGYAAEVSQIKGEDLNGDGKSDSGTKKKKVLSYIESLDVSDAEKMILRKMSYPSEDQYNSKIVRYLNSRDDISYNDMKSILEALGAKVNDRGYITW